jgi:multicomponent Na+:H+ antiporter subunit E
MQRLLLFLLVSAAIFEARRDSIIFMVLAALAARVAVRALPDEASPALRPLRLLRFLPWFLVQSARGGMDVAWRAFRGSAAVSPGFVEFHTGIRSMHTRVAFVSVLSTMPGTFSARLEADRVIVHVLDNAIDHQPRLRDLEQRIAHMFGEARA